MAAAAEVVSSALVVNASASSSDVEAARAGVVEVLKVKIGLGVLDCSTGMAVVASGTASGVGVDTTTADVVVGGCAAAAVAKLPVKVVRERGTAVHRWPSIVVMENPAGRFALVDMLRKESDTSRCSHESK